MGEKATRLNLQTWTALGSTHKNRNRVSPNKDGCLMRCHLVEQEWQSKHQSCAQAQQHDYRPSSAFYASEE